MTLLRRVRTALMWPLGDDCLHFCQRQIDEDDYMLEDLDDDAIELTNEEYDRTHPWYYEDAGEACLISGSWMEHFRWDAEIGNWEPFTTAEDLARIEAAQ